MCFFSSPSSFSSPLPKLFNHLSSISMIIMLLGITKTMPYQFICFSLYISIWIRSGNLNYGILGSREHVLTKRVMIRLTSLFFWHRYMLATIIIGIVFNLVQIAFTLFNIVKNGNSTILFDFFGDKVRWIYTSIFLPNKHNCWKEIKVEK